MCGACRRSQLVAGGSWLKAFLVACGIGMAGQSKQKGDKKRSDGDWKCPTCTKQFQNDWFNNASRTECKHCGKNPKGCLLFGGGRHPGLDADGKPKPLPPKTKTAPPAASPPASKDKQAKQIDQLKKEKAALERKNKKLEEEAAEHEEQDDSMDFDEQKSTEVLKSEADAVDAKRKKVASLCKEFPDDDDLKATLARLETEHEQRRRKVHESKDPDEQQSALSGKAKKLKEKIAAALARLRAGAEKEDEAVQEQANARKDHTRLTGELAAVHADMEKLRTVRPKAFTHDNLQNCVVNLHDTFHMAFATGSGSVPGFDHDRMLRLNEMFAGLHQAAQEIGLVLPSPSPAPPAQPAASAPPSAPSYLSAASGGAAARTVQTHFEATGTGVAPALVEQQQQQQQQQAAAQQHLENFPHLQYQQQEQLARMCGGTLALAPFAPLALAPRHPPRRATPVRRGRSREGAAASAGRSRSDGRGEPRGRGPPQPSAKALAPLELPSPDRAAGSTIASKEPAAESKHLQQKPKLAKHSTDDELLARTNRFMVLADPDEPDEQESDDV